MNAFQKFLADKPFRFITEKDLAELIKLHRLCRVLVRCGHCRFICSAQDGAHLIKAIEAIGDYVRDVSVDSATMRNAVLWQPEPTIATVATAQNPLQPECRLAEVSDKAKALEGRSA